MYGMRWFEAYLIKDAALKSNVELQPQQTSVVEKLKTEPGVLAYHGLGSGKTLASIAAGESIPGPKQVIVPAALRENYKKELGKFVRGRPHGYHIQSYNAASKKEDMPEAGLTIFDEAQRMGREGTALSHLGGKAKGKVLLLSGTPVRNEPSEIVPLLRAIARDRGAPNSARAFNEKFVKDQLVYPGFWGSLTGATPGLEKHLTNIDQLQKILKGRVDYHASAGQFPKVNEQHIDVDMTPDQTDMYHGLTASNPALAYKIRKNLPPSKLESTQLNAFLAGVRQVSNNPNAYSTALKGDTFANSPKLQRMYQEIEQRHKDPDFKGVVYSNYIDSGIHPLADHLNKQGIPTGMFTGQLSDPARRKLVDDYNRGKIKVLAISGAGSEGLDLKGTQLLQVMEPHWNKARIDQVIGRAVRHQSHSHLPPEKQQVTVQRFYANPSPDFMQRWGLSDKETGADRYLQNMSDRKQKLVNQLLDILKEVGSPPPK